VIAVAAPAAAAGIRGLPLAGAFNLRDFGGYATAEGGTVRWGMLYRSGLMSHLTEEDARQLRALGIRAICDFRRGNERAAQSTRWHGTEIDYYCRDYEELTGQLGAMMMLGETSAESVRQAMIALYCDIPLHHAPAYRAMFETLLSGRVPLIINCSAGKDRTGVGAALVVAALGVPRDLIVGDYLLTNDHANWDLMLRHLEPSRRERMQQPVMAPLLAADAAYLESFFGFVDRNCGGIEGYLAGELDVDASARDALRGLLVD
jgi:protein-tyrosine phosphatase